VAEPKDRKRKDSGIRRLPSGSYQAMWRGPDGTQHGRTFRTLREARDYRRAALEDIRRGQYVHQPRRPVLFSEWVELWTETHLPTVAPTTQATISWVLNRHILPRFAGRPLAGIARREVQLWVQDLEGSGLARASVAKCYAVLSQVMGEAVDEELIARSPCRGIKFAASSGPTREPRALSSAEAARLLEALTAGPAQQKGQSKDPIARAADAVHPGSTGPARAAYTLVLFLLGSGCRWGEATGLRRRHVHLLRRPPYVEVVESLHEVSGKLYHGPPKTRSSRRRIPLPSVVARTLAAHLPANGDPEDLVFTAPRGGPWRRRNFGTRVWQPALERAGLEGLRVHDLRHSYASILENHGVPRVITAELLGHAGGSGITTHYVHAFESAVNEAVKIVDDWLGAAELGRGVGG
jgi:integrase